MTEHPLDTMPKAVAKRLDFINEKCLALFGTRFSRNTLSKPEYRSLWHPKYIKEVATKKEPGFSFKLAIGCLKAIARKVVVTIETTYKLQENIIQKSNSFKIKPNKLHKKTIAPPICSIDKNEPEKIAEIQVPQKPQQKTIAHL